MHPTRILSASSMQAHRTYPPRHRLTGPACQCPHPARSDSDVSPPGGPCAVRTSFFRAVARASRAQNVRPSLRTPWARAQTISPVPWRVGCGPPLLLSGYKSWHAPASLVSAAQQRRRRPRTADGAPPWDWASASAGTSRFAPTPSLKLLEGSRSSATR
jgi:hypothetical protein